MLNKASRSWWYRNALGGSDSGPSAVSFSRDGYGSWCCNIKTIAGACDDVKAITADWVGKTCRDWLRWCILTLEVEVPDAVEDLGGWGRAVATSVDGEVAVVG